jgi:hypothetical protein
MKKTKTVRRMQLKQETLRKLTSDEMVRAAGGYAVLNRTVDQSLTNVEDACCCTFYCPSENLPCR